MVAKPGHTSAGAQPDTTTKADSLSPQQSAGRGPGRGAIRSWGAVMPESLLHSLEEREFGGGARLRHTCAATGDLVCLPGPAVLTWPR